ncbi:MAG TPA: AAA family ATPase, partial [Acidimicrobiia bacterium]|nr:AAA family ATPase [Acidimicrobiia bacterium]
RAAPPDELQAEVGSRAPGLARLLPELTLADADRPAGLDPETERARLFEAVDGLIAEMSAGRPVLFVLDDVHWADRPTLGLLRRLLQSDRPGAVLFLATYRDTDVDRRHPLGEVLADFRREPRVTRIALGGLDEDGLGAMLADRAGHEPPRDFVRVLYDETEGNPFFVEEVIAHLVETGTIYQRDGIWVSDLQPEDLGLPEGVRDVVGRRLSRLSDQANGLLTVGAVVGRDFDLATIVAASGMDRDEALDAIDEALGTGLVVEVPSAVGRYSFSHALVRQTLAEEISGPRRARLHWKVGEALASRADASLPLVAFHLCEGVLAGDVTRAAEAAVVAAEHARDLAAPEESRELAQRAMDVLSDAGADEPELRCRALLVLGEGAAVVAQDLLIARDQLAEAAALARANGWADYAGRASIAYGWLFTPGESDPRSSELARTALELGASSAWRATFLTTIANFHISEGNFDLGVEYLDQAWDAAKAPDTVPAARFHAALGRTSYLQAMPDLGGHTDAAAAMEAAASEAGSTTWLAFSQTFQATVALRLGDRDEVERRTEAVLRFYTHSSNQPDLLTMNANLALMDGRFDDSDALAIDVLGRVDPMSASYLNASAQIAAGLYWRGRDAELISAIRGFPSQQWPQAYLLDLVCASTLARRGERADDFDALAAGDFARLPLGYHRTGSLCHAGSAVAWLGERRLAPALVELLEAYAGLFLCAPVACLVFDAADSVRGLLLMTLERVDEAVACFEAAAELSTRARDLPHATMNAHRLARALLVRDAPGDRERARTLATDALTDATRLGLVPDAGFAQGILDEL